MALRKGVQGLAIPRNKIFARLAADRHIGNSKVQSDRGNNHHLKDQTSKVVRDSNVKMANTPSLLGGKPDSYWLIKWQSLDLKSAIASQLEFFKTEPDFNNSDRSYIYFFNAIQNTILKSKTGVKATKKDARARSNLKLLTVHFENLANRSRYLLREKLDHITDADYGQYRTFADIENVLDSHDSFLLLTARVACILDLEEEWIFTSKLVKRARGLLSLLKQQSLDNYISSTQDVQPAKPPVNTAGPLSEEMLKMDCESSEAVWPQWVEGCIAYFEYWTADSSQETPAKDFVRHLSQFRLAMELFLRHKSIPEGKRSILLALSKKYMRQYSDYAARELEKQYAKLRDDVKRSGIYETEAAFGHLADELEVFANEAPSEIDLETWNEAIPAILPKERVLVAKNALNLLYKDFQIKRYPEDETAYLWLLTWRNIKYMLPYWTSHDLGAVWPEDSGPSVVIQPRNLALPFVEKNVSQLLEIVRKDNDALYQKEIEGLVGDYCAYIDRYVRGKAEGADPLYREYNTIWNNKKRLPFAQLVSLEESLLKKGDMPTNSSQMISHRVVVRMNHIMEGPRPFRRWEVTDTGAIKTYSPTSTWVEEQRSLTQQAGFTYDPVGRGSPSHSSYDQPQRPAAGTGAGGDDNSDGDGERNPRFGDNEESSGSEEEVEVISPGGTKRVERRRKGKRMTLAVTAGTQTKDEQLVKLRGSTNSDSMGSHSGFQGGEGEDRQARRVLSGLHPIPANSIVHHRRRLNAHRVQEPSAAPNAQYPLPETAAPQRAAALQIARELADRGIFTEGPRPEDVQSWINPALRLPLSELDNRPDQPGQSSRPHVVRGTLTRIRSVLGSPFFGRSSTRSRPRATPCIPESNAQRARLERQAQYLAPSVLRRQADRFAVTKSPLVGARRSRRSPGTLSGLDQSATDSDLPWSDKENQSPFRSSSANDSNLENESPEKDSHQENQESAHATQAQANADDWNSPSPPHEYDNRIYHGSPFRTPDTPTPVRRGNSHHFSGSRQHDLPPPGTHTGNGKQDDQNINASPLALPEDDGHRPELDRLSQWIHMELASNNPDMRAAYQIYHELFRTQQPNTWTYLFELLRAHTEMVTFGNYVFERNVTFGPEARPQLSRGVPATVRPPSTPRRQIDEFSKLWWNDPFEGARQGQRRPAAAWDETPHEARMIPTSHHPSKSSGIGAPGHHPIGEVIYDPTASLAAGSYRTWSWSANSETGLPQRDFDIFLDPENRTNTNSRNLSKSVGTAACDGHGQINVRVPSGWSIDVGPARGVRSAAPSPETGLHGSGSSSGSAVHPQGGQEVTNTGPGVVIHQDSPSGSRSRSGSGFARNAQNRFRPPHILGLIDPPAQQQGGEDDEVAETSDHATSSSSSSTKTSSRSSKQTRSKSNDSSSSSSGSSKGKISNGNNPITTSSSSSDHQPAATNAPNSTSPTPTTPTPTATNQTQTPWYLSWSTSTVTHLRTELRQRGIALNDSSLRLKQQMIDRLKRDDAENGVGGEWRPDDHVEDEEEGGAAEEKEAEEEEKQKKKGKGNKRRRTDPFDESEGDGDNEGKGEEAQGKGKRRKMAKGNEKGKRRTI